MRETVQQAQMAYISPPLLDTPPVCKEAPTTIDTIHGVVRFPASFWYNVLSYSLVHHGKS